MQAPAVFTWPQQADAVQVALLQGQTVVLCLTQPPGNDRPAARAAVRLALQTALGRWRGCPALAVLLHSQPGTPVRLQHPDCAVGLSISHENGLSLAAIAPGASVGVDLLSTAALPDADECLRLAQDYLTPQTTQQLAALPDAERPLAFAHAWTAWEAGLKCAGLGVEEWAPARGAATHAHAVLPLALPPGYAGALATGYLR